MTETPPKPDARQLERLAAFLRLIPENGALDRLLRGAALLEHPPTTSANLASDILHGAGQISHFLYGNAIHRRKVYRLVAARSLPAFRLGTMICARKSVLIAWIREGEGLD